MFIFNTTFWLLFLLRSRHPITLADVQRHSLIVLKEVAIEIDSSLCEIRNQKSWNDNLLDTCFFPNSFSSKTWCLMVVYKVSQWITINMTQGCLSCRLRNYCWTFFFSISESIAGLVMPQSIILPPPFDSWYDVLVLKCSCTSTAIKDKISKCINFCPIGPQNLSTKIHFFFFYKCESTEN